MNDQHTLWQPVEPTIPNTYDPYNNLYDTPIPPPPPKQKRPPWWSLAVALVIALLLLAATGLVYGVHSLLAGQVKPTPVVAATPTSVPTQMPTVDPHYTASSILLDMGNAGCHCGVDAGYGTTIWNYTDQNYFVHEHATSSATWEDPPQNANSDYVGVWVYVDAATAEQAYTEVGNDQGTGLAHYQWPTEYQHGRCLLLIRSAFGNGAVPWPGYDQVINQYCV